MSPDTNCGGSSSLHPLNSTITTTMIGSPINDCSGGGGGGGSSTTTIQQNQNNCLVTLTANHSHLGSFIDHYPSFNAVFGPINSAATTTANNNSAAAANVSGNSSIVAAGSTIIDGGGGGGGYNFSIQHPHNPLGTSLSLLLARLMIPNVSGNIFFCLIFLVFLVFFKIRLSIVFFLSLNKKKQNY